MGRAMLSKSLIQFSVDGWGYVPSLLFDLRPNCGGGNEDNGTSFSPPDRLGVLTAHGTHPPSDPTSKLLGARAVVAQSANGSLRGVGAW